MYGSETTVARDTFFWGLDKKKNKFKNSSKEALTHMQYNYT